MTMTDEKAAARKAAFARRRSAHAEGLDGAAQAALADFLAQHSGSVLAGYMPIRTEVNPLPVMADWAGVVGVPVIRGPGEALDFHRWTQGAPMQPGPYGAQVPEVAEVVVPTVVIVPLVAFDNEGYRLGYGGGFYDRTLELLRATGPLLAVGFGYAAQQGEIPREATDQRLDAMVTDQGVLTFGA